MKFITCRGCYPSAYLHNTFTVAAQADLLNTDKSAAVAIKHVKVEFNGFFSWLTAQKVTVLFGALLRF